MSLVRFARHGRTAVLAIAIVAGSSGAARAQEHGSGPAGPGAATAPAAIDTRKPLVTDRPDFTESSEIVEPGLVQFESGFSFESDRHNSHVVRSVTVPAALLRLGLSARTELRLGADGFLSEIQDGARVSGASDFEVGFKLRLLNQSSAGFDMAIIPMVSVPVGAEGFTSGGADPTVKLTFARDLPAGFGVSGNINIASVSDGDGRFSQRAISVSLGHDLVAGWGGFFEAYGFTPMDRGTTTGATLDWGISRPVGGNFQLDFEAGRGLTGPAPDWFVGIGFAVRGRVAGRTR